MRMATASDTYREDGAFATAVWHREDIPDLPLEVPATWIVGDTIQKQGVRCVINTSCLFTPSRFDARIVGIAVVGCSGLNHIQPVFS